MARVNPQFQFNNTNSVSLQNQLRAGLASFTQNLSSQGTQLFQSKPGRVFNQGNNNFYYNSGTASDGSYIPPGTFSQSSGFNIQGLRAAGTASKPANSQAHFELSKLQLDLVDNGNGTFSRNGFVGTYTKLPDGGIYFSGGHHSSNQNIKFPPQVYYNGFWYHVGSNERPLTLNTPASKNDNFIRSSSLSRVDEKSSKPGCCDESETPKPAEKPKRPPKPVQRRVVHFKTDLKRVNDLVLQKPFHEEDYVPLKEDVAILRKHFPDSIPSFHALNNPNYIPTTEDIEFARTHPDTYFARGLAGNKNFKPGHADIKIAKENPGSDFDHGLKDNPNLQS